MRRGLNQSTLTPDGFAEIERVFTQYDNSSESLENIITSELGADRILGASHVFDLPRNMKNETYIEGPENREYVLKVCFGHSDSTYRSHPCSNHMESWTWEEAVRRGDEDLFAPVVGSDNDYRWIVVEKGYKWSRPATGKIPNYTQKMKSKLRRRGWMPADIEVHQIEGQTVVTDYELVFPVDLYEGLYHQSFQQPRLGEWKQFSKETYEAMEQQERFRRRGF